ncbi:protein FMC1 homolog [Rhopilema esculentum]|uniref:protein FMC1 homolog n=1 Tax=Rhopilema esculentum TaxID=499914 RepID=UPI0031D6E703
MKVDKMADSIRLIRNLLKELRILGNQASGGHLPMSWRISPAYETLTKTVNCLRHESDKEVIKKNMFEGELYLNYIQSTRKEQELQNFYKGAGESSIADIAARVGLKLPEQYMDGKKDT